MIEIMGVSLVINESLTIRILFGEYIPGIVGGFCPIYNPYH